MEKKRKIICAIVGRGIADIGNGNSETYYKNIEIKQAILEKVSELIEDGVTDFLLSAEYGFPMWAGEILLGLREVRLQQGLSSFRLHVCMPWEGQASAWADDIHERLYAIHSKADTVHIVCSKYRDECYISCDYFMTAKCHILLTDEIDNEAVGYAKLLRSQAKIVVCDSLVQA